MTKRLQNIENSNGRITKECKNAWKGAIVLVVIFIIDNIYSTILKNYYQNPDYFISHMRGGVAITFSLLLAISDLIVVYYIWSNAKDIKIMITLSNGIPVKISGWTRILSPISKIVAVVSIISIIYDIYEILFIHLLGVAL